MEEIQNIKKLKTAVVVLSVLLALSLAGLVAALLYNHFVQADMQSVVVENNRIAAKEETVDSRDTTVSSTLSLRTTSAQRTTVSSLGAGPAFDTVTQLNTASSTSAPVENTVSDTVKSTANTIELYQNHPSDNVPFAADNLFPGDTETKYYCVRVSHKGDVTVRFHADVQPGSEKLAEVLQCRVVLSTTGETLYEGLMKDMPAALTHELSASEETQSELYYEITAWLDTSVGNEYMNKTLLADFDWWVEETENLVPPTGNTTHIGMWIGICAVACCLFVVVVILAKRKKGEQHEH